VIFERVEDDLSDKYEPEPKERSRAYFFEL